jgi:hypothetical protein
MNKPSLIEQIEFIQGARKLVDCDSIVELDAKNFEMLKAIEENLIMVRNIEYSKDKMQTKIEFESPVFDNSEEPDQSDYETTGDYNRHEEAERMHRVQRDLK